MNSLPYLTHALDRHLTDEQMSGLLDQPKAAGATLRLHLQSCPDCRLELASLRESLSNFRLAATSLSAQTPGLAARSETPRRMSFHLHRHAWAATFASVVVLLGVSVSIIGSSHVSPAVNAPVTSVAQSDPVTESDEALLDGIQRDLQTSIPPSLEPLAVSAASSTTNSSN